jgi:hypothetical protein
MAIILTGANQKTEWWDLRGVASDVCFLLTGDFNQEVGIHYSNLESYDKEASYLRGTATYTSAIGPLQLPFGIARFVRFYSGGSWGAGTTCTPSFANAEGPDGQLFVPQVQA